MTTMPAVPMRSFNGLNGAEIRKRILQEVEARLEQDGRFGAHLVFPIVTWNWTLELETAPTPGIIGPGSDGVLRTEIHGRIAVEGEAGDGAPAARRESALLDPRGRPAPEGARPFPERPTAQPQGDPRGAASVPLEATLENRLARLEQMIAKAVQAIPPAVPPPPAVLDDPAGPVPTATHHPDVQMTTATGLPITGGARPSPGAGLADSFGGGSAVGTVAAVYGVRHPPLDEGGVGAPDAVRREAGLPIPQMQQSGGGIVDLPAGSF